LWVTEDPRTVAPFAALADLLLVVDDTGSMADEQAALAALFPEIVATLDDAGLDYHVGVVTTDLADPTDSGRLREVSGDRWVAPDTVDGATVLSAMATVGTAGSPLEAGLGAAYLAEAVEGTAYNAGFFRSSGSLGIVVLSDEDDQTAPAVTTPAAFTAWLDALRDPALTAASAIAAPGANARYSGVVAGTGGFQADIGAPATWLALFDDVIADLGASRSALLPAGLDPATIEVWWAPAGLEPEPVPAADVTYDAVTGQLDVGGAHPSGELVTVY
ncbi:MAG: hypothetical protein R3F59_28595, partial [Myxococcota bacterium]